MHTNNTSHYNLPQFIGSDIPNPLTDWNDSMQDIDTAMYEIKTQADEIGSDIVQDESDISDLQSQANLTDDNITLLNQQTTAARTAATDAQDAANRNASNIVTLQQSVTNNRTSITQYNNRFNQNVPFAFGIENVEDPDNPGQTIEKYGYYTNDDPAEFVAFGESLAHGKCLLYSYSLYNNSCEKVFGSLATNNPPTGCVDDSYIQVNSDTQITMKKNCKVNIYLYGRSDQTTTSLIKKNGTTIVNGSQSGVIETNIDLETGDILTMERVGPAASNPSYNSGAIMIQLV